MLSYSELVLRYPNGGLFRLFLKLIKAYASLIESLAWIGWSLDSIGIRTSMPKLRAYSVSHVGFLRVVRYAQRPTEIRSTISLSEYV